MSSLGMAWGGERMEAGARWGAWLGWFALGAALGLPALAAMRLDPLHAAMMAGAAAAGMAAVGLVLGEPSWGACALILIIYWNASDVVTDQWGFSWLLRLAILGTGGAFAWRRLTLPRGAAEGAWRWPVAGPALAYGAAQAASAAGAIDRASAGGALLEYGKDLVVLYLVANLLATPRAWRRGINALLAGVALLALPVVYQGVSGSHNQFWGFGSMKWAEIVPGEFGWRLGGALGDPNFLAMVLVASLPMAAVQVVERGAGVRRRGLAGAALGLALGATFFTYSRSAMLGVGMVAAAMVWKYRRRRGVIALLAAGAVACGVAVAPRDLGARVGTLFQASTLQQRPGADASIRIRRNAYLAGGLMFLAHPLLGVGPANYEANYLHYSALVGLGGEDVVRDPHSLPVQVAAEGGLAGLATFALLLAASFGLMERGRRRLRRLGADKFADLLWSLELAMATYLMLSLFLHGAYFRHFLLLLALGSLGGALAGGEAGAAAAG